MGNLHREGEVCCTQAVESFDHDYAYLATGKVIPHGIYDMKSNEALMTIGTSHETAHFICDAGGANSYRHHIFKVELQKLSNAIGFSVRICHYPPYTSQWNPYRAWAFSTCHKSNGRR